MNTKKTIKSIAITLLTLISPLLKHWAYSYSLQPKNAPNILMRLLVLLDLHIFCEATLINGCKMIVDPYDAVGGKIYRDGQFEPETVEFVYDNLKEGMTFIDIGANIGQYTLLAASIVGDSGKVISVEAAPYTYTILNKNISLNNLSNVVSHNVAVSNSKGFTTFHLGHYGNSGASSLKPTINTGVREIKVKTNTLDNLLIGLDKTDIMKIDVEGAELMVLNGGKTILKNFKPMLILEFSDENFTGEFGVSTTDLVALLKELNYVVYIIKKGGLDKWDESKKYPSWYNVACIHETKITNALGMAANLLA